MDVKTTLPLLPLRDIVVFPGMVIPLFVGRDKSITALNEVMKKDKNGAGKRIVPKIGRNDMCPCGSSQKFKKCCVDWKNYAKKQLAIQKEVEKAEGERLKAEKNAGKLPALPGEEHVQGVNPQGAAELPGEEKGGES